jgi:hypothetical protein
MLGHVGPVLVKRKESMKKNETTDREKNRKPRRLSLNRETIQVLDDPALLELARGGSNFHSCDTATNYDGPR